MGVANDLGVVTRKQLLLAGNVVEGTQLIDVICWNMVLLLSSTGTVVYVGHSSGGGIILDCAVYCWDILILYGLEELRKVSKLKLGKVASTVGRSLPLGKKDKKDKNKKKVQH